MTELTQSGPGAGGGYVEGKVEEELISMRAAGGGGQCGAEEKEKYLGQKGFPPFCRILRQNRLCKEKHDVVTCRAVRL